MEPHEGDARRQRVTLRLPERRREVLHEPRVGIEVCERHHVGRRPRAQVQSRRAQLGGVTHSHMTHSSLLK